MQIINNGEPGGGIVVGHTPQTNINSVCSGRVWLTDNGMSQAFGERDDDTRIQVLEIRSGKNPRVIYWFNLVFYFKDFKTYLSYY